MPLHNWIKEASRLLVDNSGFPRSGKPRRLRRKDLPRFNVYASQVPIRTHSETLEDRVLPASLVWVGDINPQFASEASGNTNWDTNTLPASGDNLTFPDITGNLS